MDGARARRDVGSGGGIREPVAERSALLEVVCFSAFVTRFSVSSMYFWDFVETLAFLNREAIDLPCSPRVELLHACVITHSVFGIVHMIL